MSTVQANEAEGMELRAQRRKMLLLSKVITSACSCGLYTNDIFVRSNLLAFQIIWNIFTTKYQTSAFGFATLKRSYALTMQ